MVKHGRNKKRRAGRLGRTQLKNKTFKRWDPNPKIGDKTIKALWDTLKSPTENMANLGLVCSPNMLPGGGTHRTSKKATVNVVELFDVPDSDAMAQEKKNRLPLSEEEQKYIAKCMAKYGNDYQKMFRDIKLNKMQHTENQLQKMGSRFLLLDTNQLKVEVPKSVQKLMAIEQ